MSATTTQPTAKRVRIETPTIPDASSPTAIAEHAAKFAVSGLSLHSSITPLVLSWTKDCITSYRSLVEAKKAKDKVESSSLPPRSARMKFALTTSPKFAHNEKIQALSKEADEVIKTMQDSLKIIIVKKIEAEIEELTKEVSTTIVDSGFRLVKTMLLSRGIQTDDIAKVNTRFAFLNITNTRNLGLALDQALSPFDIIGGRMSAVDTQNEMTAIIDQVIVQPLLKFDEALVNAKKVEECRAYALAASVEHTTARTTMAIDEEDHATPETLRAEIEKQVRAATKSLTKKLESMAQAVKKDEEGPVTGASTKKKKKSSQGSGNVNNNNKKNTKQDRAAVPNNGTTEGKDGKKKNNKNKKGNNSNKGGKTKK